MVLVVKRDLVELRTHAADPARPGSGELVATARPAGDGWVVLWERDGHLDELRDRAAVEDLLIGHMKR